MTLPDPADEEAEAGTSTGEEAAPDGARAAAGGTAAPTMTLAAQEALRRKLQDKFH